MRLKKDVLLSCHDLGTKMQFWVLVRNWISDFSDSTLRGSTIEPKSLFDEQLVDLD